MTLNRKIGFFVAIAPVVLAGCQTDPQRAPVISQPKTPIVKNITNFTNSLRCMDSLFVAYGKKGFRIMSDGIPDRTGKISAGTRDMLISTLSKMTQKSNAFQFIDVAQQGSTVLYVQDSVIGSWGQGGLPQFYIRGAVTQFDSNVTDDGQDFSFGLSPFLSLGYSRDQIVSVMSLDMNIGDVRTRSILPGNHATNSIALVMRSDATNAAAVVKSADVAFGVSNAQSEGAHQSLRTLIELSLIEVLGKLTRVPYWRCLELESTDPRFQSVARDWYDAQTPQERIQNAQTAMAQIGAYYGAQDGRMSAAFRQAVNRYKAANDLLADGRVDFDLYYSLLTTDRRSRAVAAPAPERGSSEVPGSIPTRPVTQESDIGLQLRPSFDEYRRLRTGDKIRFRVSVEKPAYVFCYYEFSDGGETLVERIFPNRFQRNNFLQPGRTTFVPPADEPFSIVLSEADIEERVGCIATTKRYTSNNTPTFLEVPDLQPVRNYGRVGLKDAIWSHQSHDRYDTDVKTVSYVVRASPK